MSYFSIWEVGVIYREKHFITSNTHSVKKYADIENIEADVTKNYHFYESIYFFKTFSISTAKTVI